MKMQFHLKSCTGNPHSSVMNGGQGRGRNEEEELPLELIYKQLWLGQLANIHIYRRR